MQRTNINIRVEEALNVLNVAFNGSIRQISCKGSFELNFYKGDIIGYTPAGEESLEVETVRLTFDNSIVCNNGKIKTAYCEKNHTLYFKVILKEG